MDLAESILEEGCVTGDRVNGLCDGVTGDWCSAPFPGFCCRPLLCGAAVPALSASMPPVAAEATGAKEDACTHSCHIGPFCALPLRVAAGVVEPHARLGADAWRPAGHDCRYVKFDTFHPAVDIGLPVTRVISRVVLQRKLAEKAEELEGKGVLCNDCHVVDYEEARPPLCCTIPRPTSAFFCVLHAVWGGLLSPRNLKSGLEPLFWAKSDLWSTQL